MNESAMGEAALDHPVRRLFATRPASGERTLIAAARQGSEAAIEQLVRTHWPTAHRTSYLLVHDSAAAEDIAQESLMAALGALDRFDRRREFAPWLHRIVVNNSLTWLRAKGRRPEISTAQVPEPTAMQKAPELSDPLLEALRALDPDQRAVVVMRHLLEMTPGEIADVLELPRGTVNSRIRRALDALGDRLGEEIE